MRISATSTPLARRRTVHRIAAGASLVAAIVLFVPFSARDVLADCNRKCDASQRDAEGCCKTPIQKAPDKQQKVAPPQWIAASGGRVPADIPPAGREQPPGQEPLWACRARYAGPGKQPGVHPGKVGPHLRSCSIGYGGQEFGIASYDVLAGNVAWVAATGGQIPGRAIQGGGEAPEDGGQPLFVCRASHPAGTTGVHVGKIRQGFTGCSFGWGGKEIVVGNYEVAVEP
jgi:hypothetical protein